MQPETVEPINTEEMMIQNFEMDHPNEVIKENQFSSHQKTAAHDALVYSNLVDEALGVEITNDDSFHAHASRDVLATYKTLLYRSRYFRECAENELYRWKQIAFVSLGGVLTIIASHYV